MKIDWEKEAIVTKISMWRALSDTLAGTYFFIRGSRVLHIGENNNIKKRLSMYEKMGVDKYFDFQGVEVMIPLATLTPEKAELPN